MADTGQVVAMPNLDPIISIRSSYKGFSPPEQRCADLILHSAQAVTQMSITDFALKADTSEATVVRFCKKLGFAGYPKLRIALATNVGFRAGITINDENEIELGISHEDSTSEIISKVGSSAGMTIAMTSQLVSSEILDSLTEALYEARTIGAFGAGASSLVAADISYKFNRLGHGCVHWSDHHAALTSISTLSKGDVLFLISHSGNTPETIAVATEFKNRGVSIAVITNSPRSGLAQLADFLFLTQAERNVLRVGATVSRIAQLLIVDCIAIAAARRSWEISRAALTDASAAIERQINYKDWLYEGSIASATDSLGG